MEFYSGCGNTFYITLYDEKYDNSETVKKICNNEVDGFIMVKQNPLTFHFYNNDGSLAKMCGNGIRCFIHYCYNHKIITKLKNDVTTLAGIYHTEITSTDPFIVKVNMVKPKFTYFDGKEYINEPMNINGKSYSVSLIDTGVWHVVIPFYDELEYTDAINKAKEIYYSDNFKGKHNINFVNVKNNKIYLKTFEHGVDDFTKACGTGSVATYIILKKIGVITENSTEIIQDGGTLTISNVGDEIFMSGLSEQIK